MVSSTCLECKGIGCPGCKWMGRISGPDERWVEVQLGGQNKVEVVDSPIQEDKVEGQGRERLNQLESESRDERGGLRPTRSFVGHYKVRATRCLHNHPENKTIGANLLYLRELAGFSQAEVWKILKKRGIATLSCLESGQFHRVEPLLLHRMLVLYEADMLTLGHLMDPDFIKNRQACPPKKSLETLARQGRKK